jgi:hypothetical protein
MSVGDPDALGVATRLAAREKDGSATAAERSALWGLRALHEENAVPCISDAQAKRCIAILAAAMCRRV